MKDYKISFEKNINDSYMYVDVNKIDTNAYESILLKNENVDRILKYYIVNSENGFKLRYVITNLISLDSYVKKHSLNQKDISFIINEISHMLINCENYLISENSIILNPSSIMIALSKDNNIMKKKLLFTAIPTFNGDFYEQLVKLLLYILKNVDRNDRKSILLAYNLFSESAKENFTINNLLNIINQNGETSIEQNNYNSNEVKNNTINLNNDSYITENENVPTPTTVNDVAIAYNTPSDLISYNDEVDIDEYTKNILETKYVSEKMEKEQNRKNIEYLKSLELDNINESYDINTLKAYRDKIVADSEKTQISAKIPGAFLNIKNIICIMFGIFLPIFLKNYLGMEALVSNFKYLIGIEIVLIAIIALDIIDNLKRKVMIN